MLKFTPSIRMWAKSDLRDFECGVVVGTGQAGQSILETANLLGLSCTTISRLYSQEKR